MDEKRPFYMEGNNGLIILISVLATLTIVFGIIIVFLLCLVIYLWKRQNVIYSAALDHRAATNSVHSNTEQVTVPILTAQDTDNQEVEQQHALFPNKTIRDLGIERECLENLKRGARSHHMSQLKTPGALANVYEKRYEEVTNALDDFTFESNAPKKSFSLDKPLERFSFSPTKDQSMNDEEDLENSAETHIKETLKSEKYYPSLLLLQQHSLYKILYKIGEGAFSSVYLVRLKHNTKDRKEAGNSYCHYYNYHALKFILCRNDKEKQWALKEANILSRLKQVRGSQFFVSLVDLFMSFKDEQCAQVKQHIPEELNGVVRTLPETSSCKNNQPHLANPDTINHHRNSKKDSNYGGGPKIGSTFCSTNNNVLKLANSPKLGAQNPNDNSFSLTDNILAWRNSDSSSRVDSEALDPTNPSTAVIQGRGRSQPQLPSEVRCFTTLDAQSRKTYATVSQLQEYADSAMREEEVKSKSLTKLENAPPKISKVSNCSTNISEFSLGASKTAQESSKAEDDAHNTNHPCGDAKYGKVFFDPLSSVKSSLNENVNGAMKSFSNVEEASDSHYMCMIMKNYIGGNLCYYVLQRQKYLRQQHHNKLLLQHENSNKSINNDSSCGITQYSSPSLKPDELKLQAPDSHLPSLSAFPKESTTSVSVFKGTQVLTENQVVSIAFQLLCALQILHLELDVPIIHRDIKPENVLIDSEFLETLQQLKLEEKRKLNDGLSVKEHDTYNIINIINANKYMLSDEVTLIHIIPIVLTDFGLSTHQTDDAIVNTRQPAPSALPHTDSTDTVNSYQHIVKHRGSGTRPYMSPESWYGTAPVTVKTDIWSLGALLYAIMTGKLTRNTAKLLYEEYYRRTLKPYDNDNPYRNLQETIDSMQTFETFLIKDITARGYSLALASFVALLLTPDPALRPCTKDIFHCFSFIGKDNTPIENTFEIFREIKLSDLHKIVLNMDSPLFQRLSDL